MENITKRDKLADLLKGYACFLVVFGHVIMGIRKGGITIPFGTLELELFIWTFHVGLFMFLSGYVYNITGGWKSKGTRVKFIIHKLLNLAIPYLIFSIIYILINTLIPSTNTQMEVSDILYLWKEPVAQYWFLYALFMLFLIWTVMSKFLKNWQITIFMAIIGMVGYFYNFSFGILDSAISMAIPFGVGTCLSKFYVDKIAESKKIALIITHIVVTLLVILIGVNNYFVDKLDCLLGIFSSIALISILQKSKIIKKTLEKINKKSFPIYLLHTIFTAGIRIVLIKIGIENYVIHVLLGLLFGFICPYIISSITEKHPILDIAFYPNRNIKTLKEKTKNRKETTMKIGIITHHYVKNYGAFLQMKALFETLKSLYPDAEIEIINYVNKKHWYKNILHVLHFRIGIDSIKSYTQKIRQLRIFNKYEHTIPRTKKIKNVKDILKLNFDIIVFGSDEIWNLSSSGYSPIKFGYGFENFKGKLIAYAPSVGYVNEEAEIPREICEGLKNFEKLSGRDNTTVNLIKKICNFDAPKMLDPTFLYNFDYDINQNELKAYKDKYILIYDCKLTQDMITLLKEYATKNNYKILGAGDYKDFYDEIKINLTPYEWVNLFRNAEKVITGTFHGTVFSIKYYRNFLCFPTEDNRIQKIESLLKDMKLEKQLLHLNEKENFYEMLNENVDYSYTKSYMNNQIENAKKFLSQKIN